ncbi:MAG: radical SAM protein [Kiritimatiellae bacterium]|nr:radical SAM protein [Kiritimatiellia bacterium]
MMLRLARRMMREVEPRLLLKFAWNFGWKGMRSVKRFRRRLRRGEYFPAFLFISVTDSCNLRCQGCWVTRANPPRELSAAALDRVITAGKRHGVSFFGILGGEPLMYEGLFDVCAGHPDCYFLIFTNGTLLTAETAERMRAVGNVSPLVSIEGLEAVSDERRGGKNVYAKALAALDHCRRSRLVTGVATSICRSNINELATARFVDELVRRGVHYVWYYIYRPVGPAPAPELALGPEQIGELRRFLVRVRTTAPILVVDAYWDEAGNALCPAAVGIGYHIGPGGDVEPCPPIQIAKDSILNGQGVYEAITGSEFLADFRAQVSGATRGCILLENPDLLLALMAKHAARDTSGRNAVREELAAMCARPSHHMPGREVPEESRFYRFAKRNWFFGLGAYG